MNKLILLNELKNRPNTKEFHIYPKRTGDSLNTILNRLIDVCDTMGSKMSSIETTYVIHITPSTEMRSMYTLLKTEKLGLHVSGQYTIALQCQCTYVHDVEGEEVGYRISENINVYYEPGTATSFHFRDDGGNNVDPENGISGEIYLSVGSEPQE